MPVPENTEELFDRVAELWDKPDYKAWVEQHNLKGIQFLAVRVEFEKRWNCNSGVVRFCDDIIAFYIKLYFGDFLPATKAILETWPEHMEYFKACTGLEKVFESCEEAVAFTLSDFDAMNHLFECLIMAIYQNFSKSVMFNFYSVGRVS